MKIVCIGDSLTAGYPMYTPKFIRVAQSTDVIQDHDYPYWLQTYLSDHLEDIKTENRGIPGNETTDVINRLEPDVVELSPNLSTIIIGSNDIIQRRDGSTILSNILHIHQVLRDKGIITIGATLPPVSFPTTTITSNFEFFNNKLSEQLDKLDIPWVDLFDGLSDDTYQLKEEYDIGDGVHLTKEANMIIADLFAKEILRIND